MCVILFSATPSFVRSFLTRSSVARSENNSPCRALIEIMSSCVASMYHSSNATGRLLVGSLARPPSPALASFTLCHLTGTESSERALAHGRLSTFQEAYHLHDHEALSPSHQETLVLSEDSHVADALPPDLSCMLPNFMPPEMHVESTKNPSKPALFCFADVLLRYRRWVERFVQRVTLPVDSGLGERDHGVCACALQETMKFSRAPVALRRNAARTGRYE